MFLQSVKETPICQLSDTQLLLIACASLVQFYMIIHDHDDTAQLTIYEYAVAFSVGPLTSCGDETIDVHNSVVILPF